MKVIGVNENTCETIAIQSFYQYMVFPEDWIDSTTLLWKKIRQNLENKERCFDNLTVAFNLWVLLVRNQQENFKTAQRECHFWSLKLWLHQLLPVYLAWLYVFFFSVYCVYVFPLYLPLTSLWDTDALSSTTKIYTDHNVRTLTAGATLPARSGKRPAAASSRH